LVNTIQDKYDIAISYLAEDEELAFAIYTELGEVLNIFIYTQHQEELAGKNGVEPLRNIFINKTNLIVILYRNGWGNTGWTSTEEKAIIDFGLKNKWEGILLINLDLTKIPNWFPESEIYIDFQKYSFEELIGIIKLRAQERGGEVKTITAVDRAKILEIKREYENEKKKILESEEGLKRASAEANDLFEEIDRICIEITSESSVRFEYKRQKEFLYQLIGYKQDEKLGSLGFQVNILWHQKYSNSLNNSKLILSKIDLGRIVYRNDPIIMEDLLFDFDLSHTMQNMWKNNHNNKQISTQKLADDIVKMIIDFKSS